MAAGRNPAATAPSTEQDYLPDKGLTLTPTTTSALQAIRRQRSGAGPRVRDLLLRISGIVGALLVLQLIAMSGILPNGELPTIVAIYGDFFEGLGDPDFWLAVLNTLQGWFFGLLIAAVLGIGIGVLIGSFEWAYRVSKGTIEFLRPIPSVAILPAAVLIFGPTLDLKIFLIAFATFWPILIQTVYGVHDTDPTALDTARSYGLGPFQRFITVTLPSSATYIATGLRIASAIGLVLALTTELVVGVAGIGQRITEAQGVGNITRTYSLVLAAGLIGWGLNGIVRVVEARTLHWHESFRGVAN